MTRYALTITARRHDGTEVITADQYAQMVAVRFSPMVDVEISVDAEPILVLYGVQHVRLASNAAELLADMLAKANDYDRLRAAMANAATLGPLEPR